MRRMVKENCSSSTARRCFPNVSPTPSLQLSAAEADLYKQVTDYVREEFNRADALKRRPKGTVGFALTILAAPAGLFARGHLPIARRRRERLENRLREERLLNRGAELGWT